MHFLENSWVSGIAQGQGAPYMQEALDPILALKEKNKTNKNPVLYHHTIVNPTTTICRIFSVP